MSFKLIPPGRRHGNKVYYAQIAVKGRRIEKSTHTRNKGLARKYAEALEAELYERHVLGRGPAETVADAIERYIAFRRPSTADRKYLDSLRAHAGKTLLDQVTQATFDHAAQVLYPGRAPETWNRQVYTPLQAALRHSGVNVMVRRPKLKKPRNRGVSKEAAQLLIGNAGDSDLAALLTVLFYTGCRIGEAISLTPERVDLQNKRLCFDLSKTDEDSWRPMHPEVFLALANLPERLDRVFRWQTTSGPRKPLRALCKRLGITVTPHMARHSFATWLADSGANMRDIMEAGGWSDHKSVLRYVGTDLERVRKVVEKL